LGRIGIGFFARAARGEQLAAYDHNGNEFSVTFLYFFCLFLYSVNSQLTRTLSFNSATTSGNDRASSTQFFPGLECARETTKLEPFSRLFTHRDIAILNEKKKEKNFSQLLFASAFGQEEEEKYKKSVGERAEMCL
jgi:hypothetical protein